MRSSLSRHIPRAPMTDDEMRARAADAWHESEFIGFRPEWIVNEIDRQYAKRMAERLYGKRRGT